jgi:hypothetical protein
MVFKDVQEDTEDKSSITELYKKHLESSTYNDIKGLNAQEYIEYLQKKSQ